MTPESIKDLSVQPHLLSPWLGFVVPRDEPAKLAAPPRPSDHLPKAA